MIHKRLQIDRIQQAYTDGILTIVHKTPKRDKFNTVIPGEESLEELGRYAFRIKGIHNNDRIEFGSDNVRLTHQVVIPLNYHIHAGMTGQIGEELYDIVKVYQNTKRNETEILIGKEGGTYEFKTKDI